MLVALVLITGCNRNEIKYKFKITSPDTSRYIETNFYTEKDNCVSFKEGVRSWKLCGTYTIVRINK